MIEIGLIFDWIKRNAIVFTIMAIIPVMYLGSERWRDWDNEADNKTVVKPFIKPIRNTDGAISDWQGAEPAWIIKWRNEETVTVLGSLIFLLLVILWAKHDKRANWLLPEAIALVVWGVVDVYRWYLDFKQHKYLWMYILIYTIVGVILGIRYLIKNKWYTSPFYRFCLRWQWVFWLCLFCFGCFLVYQFVFSMPSNRR